MGKEHRAVPGCPVVKTSPSSARGVVGVLRSHVSPGQKTGTENNRDDSVINSMETQRKWSTSKKKAHRRGSQTELGARLPPPSLG